MGWCGSRWAGPLRATHAKVPGLEAEACKARIGAGAAPKL